MVDEAGGQNGYEEQDIKPRLTGLPYFGSAYKENRRSRGLAGPMTPDAAREGVARRVLGTFALRAICRNLRIRKQL
jgi:hypothetical protein